jgi:hypothetical protein
MAFQQVKTTAKGNAANTGAPGPTPAPKAKPQQPDQISQVRAPTHVGYGMNSFAGRSSLNPGEQLLSPMALSLKAASDDGENVLATVVAKGTARRDSSITSQLRDIAPGNVPDAFGMASARSRQATYPGPRGAVPATTAKSDAQTIRKPS